MTNHFAGRPQRAAFTLIELLTVITIILILAGLILGIAGSAQTKAARSRAEGEIKAMATACNNFQIDSGTYPRSNTSVDTGGGTDKPIPNSTSSSGVDPNSNAYKFASRDLYRFLCGSYTYSVSTSNAVTWKKWTTSGSGTTPKPTAYFAFKDSQLSNTGNVSSGYLDPDDGELSSRTLSDSATDTRRFISLKRLRMLTATVTPPTDGYNPTFDLWSTAGYSTTSGKPYPYAPARVPRRIGTRFGSRIGRRFSPPFA